MKYTSNGQAIKAAFLVCATIMLLPFAAYAGAMSDAICEVVNGADGIQGDLGLGIATLGVCSVSAAAMLGKGSWGMAITVAVGVAIMYGAQNIAGTLGLAGGC